MDILKTDLTDPRRSRGDPEDDPSMGRPRLEAALVRDDLSWRPLRLEVASIEGCLGLR
nr:hypothetical protein Itr_chr02CG19720 [Ipomoea trifida]